MVFGDHRGKIIFFFFKRKLINLELILPRSGPMLGFSQVYVCI